MPLRTVFAETVTYNVVVRLIDINILRANFTLITKSTTFATPIHFHESQISPTEPLYNLINAHSHLRVFHHHCSHSQQGQLLHLPPLLLYTTVTTVNYYVCTNKGRICTLGTNTDELMIYKYVGQYISLHNMTNGVGCNENMK